MDPHPPPAQVAADAGLSIGELARRTTLEPATLRAWELRHGFPTARRTPSGHRRYDVETVAQVNEVLRRREAGVRLDLAISQTLAGRAPGTDSVFAELRQRHPELSPLRLRKRTLLALTWAIEDDAIASARRGDVFGAFQEESYFLRSRARWLELAALSQSAWAYAGFDTQGPQQDGHLVRVPLDDRGPMRREWAVVCDATELPVALSAWELPGQTAKPDRDRVFEAIWTVQPDAVREAARVCGQMAEQSGAPTATALVARLDRPATAAPPDAAAMQRLFSRVLAYSDAVRP